MEKSLLADSPSPHQHRILWGSVRWTICKALRKSDNCSKTYLNFCLKYWSLLQFSNMTKSRVLFHVIWIRSHNKMLGVFKVVFIRMFLPACIIALMGNVTLSNACFKLSEVKPSLIILRSRRVNEAVQETAALYFQRWIQQFVSFNINNNKIKPTGAV